MTSDPRSYAASPRSVRLTPRKRGPGRTESTGGNGGGLTGRLGPRSGEVVDRRRPIRFRWNGTDLVGFEGDTIASALLANDVQLIARSMKYHRPRSYLTADYWDPNGLVQVGDEPNVRSGHRLLAPGMEVSAQNVWPSVEHDIKAANGLVGRFLTAGFYYKTFVRPRRLWPAYERVLATFAPGGCVDIDTPHGYYDKRYSHPDVVVAGAGPAGMAAAVAAAEAGARVMLVEHEPALGGHLRFGDAGERAVVVGLGRELDRLGVEVLVDSTVTGRYEDNWLAINQRSHPGVVERLIKARAKSLVVAPGLIERPYVFAGNDKPGVMTSGAVRRLINGYAVRPGRRAVVLTANADGDRAVEILESAGVEVAAVVDARAGGDVVAAHGPARRLEEVERNDGSRVEADLLVTAIGWTAPTSLLNMAGDRPVYHNAGARFVPGAALDTVLATGGLVGDGSLDELLDHARATGRLAAGRAAVTSHRLRFSTARARAIDGPEPPWPDDDRPDFAPDPHPALYRSSTHGMVDFSEDVSSKDLLAAAAEGYDSVELLKRFTTATMGPSQGKLETVNTVAVLAEARGETIEQVGTTVWRPPFAPISLGALAGRVFEPTRRSPMHDWHEANGAVPLSTGAWIRPDHYGDPAAEVANTRNNVGIIDVSPLGKFDLRGPNVTDLLNLVYVNRWSKLAVGAVRYGVMCTDDGVVFDDGVTGRLATDRYLLTTTSSGAASVGQWMENWLQTERPEWHVSLTPVTDVYASMNLAGPKSRTLLSRLAPGLDLEPDRFGYMQVRTATVAGVEDCVVWRIGFTGELSYEVHVPADQGLEVWQAAFDHGDDLGLAPFGVEAQRIMRLEKGHFIVGQDTDGLTKAGALGLGRLVALDKPDFVGRPELIWDGTGDERDETEPCLVALQPTNPEIVPDEACQLLRPGTNEIVGRITSSRMSPTLGRSICLGQVRSDLAVAGTAVTVLLVDGRRVTAEVQGHHAHFDPEGARLRG